MAFEPQNQYRQNLMVQYGNLLRNPPSYLGALKSPLHFGGFHEPGGSQPTGGALGGGTTVPGPTSVNPGVPGATGGALGGGQPWTDPGGRTYGGEQTAAFDRPGAFDMQAYMQSRGGAEPAFARPGNGTPMDRGMTPAFDRPASALPSDNAMAPNPYSFLPPYTGSLDSTSWDIMVRTYGPILGPQLYQSWRREGRDASYRGGPGPGNANTGTGGPGNANSAGDVY